MVLLLLYHNALSIWLFEQSKLLGFTNNNNNNNKESKVSHSSQILKPPADLALLFNQFNNAIPDNNSDSENVIQSKDYNTDQLQQLNIPSKEKALSFFYFLLTK